MSPPAAQSPAALTIRADTWDARRASGWLESAALAQNVPLQQVVRLDHCLDEALANVIRHGGPTALSSPVHLQFGVRRGKRRVNVNRPLELGYGYLLIFLVL